MQDRSHKYKTLDAMRGVAALAVVFFHAKSILGINLAPGGYLAVDIFFVLSGFVIAYSFEHRLNDGLSFGAFFLARWIRFFPLLSLAVILGLVRALAALAAGNTTSLPMPMIVLSAVTSLVFVPAPIGDARNLFELNVPLWTLSFEMAVNLIYAGILFRFSNLVLGVTSAISAIIVVCFVTYFGAGDIGAIVPSAVGGFGRAMFGFCVGVLIFRTRFRINIPIFVVFAGLVVALVIPVPDGFRPAYDLAVMLLLAPILVASGAGVEPATKYARAAEYLGVISFVIYAIHQPLVRIILVLAPKLHLPTAPLGVALIAVLLLVAPAINKFYDIPARAWLKRAILGARPAQAL
jgi:peptidoglycan/LPS O-acetylase OafA/YrhL